MIISARRRTILTTLLTVVALAALIGVASCAGGSYSSGGGGGNGGGGGGGTSIPAAPQGLSATAGNAQVSLVWTASTGTTSYYVKRSTVSGGPYTQVATPGGASYVDPGLTNGTKYYYVVSAYNSAGESANSSEVSATPTAPVTVPAAPTGLAATAGNAQVSLSWNASAGATSYHIKRSATSGGPYTQVAATNAPSDVDSGLTNGTTYYYVVSALNSAGESANSTEAIATPSSGSSAAIQVVVDALSDRHAISPYVYGVNFPSNAAYITDSGTTLVRWGGNASTRYNWKNLDTNAANDYYYINRPMGSAPLYSDSTQFVTNVAAAGGSPLMTIGMLPWAAKDATSYSFSVVKYGTQCATDPYNSDAGNGVKSDCSTNVTGNDPHDADIALLDGPPAGGDPAGSVYRDQWVTALATAFGNGSPHFYDMDNEIDIWGGTHRDIHPNSIGLQRDGEHVYDSGAQPEELGSAGDSVWAGELLLVVLLERREQQRQKRARAAWTFSVVGERSLLVGPDGRDAFGGHVSIFTRIRTSRHSGYTLAQKQAVGIAESFATTGIRRI